MFTEEARLTALENTIIHKAGNYTIGRDQSSNCHTLDFEDFS